MINNRYSPPQRKNMRIIPLGGCGEFGINCTIYQEDNKFVVVDVGALFPDPEQLGVSTIIPDVKGVFKKLGYLQAYIITHGHLDHIGALPHVYAECPAPIYATPWTYEMIKRQFKKHHLPIKHLNKVEAGQSVYCNPFSIQYIHVNHSIPDAAALYIKTSFARAFHTGDFKFDRTPPDGKSIDARELNKISRMGVDILLTDSTNASRPGFGASESSVVKPLEDIISKARGRVFITGFSSNFWRIQSVLKVCRNLNKKLIVDGRGLKDSIDIAQTLGRLSPNLPTLVDERQAMKTPNNKLVVLLSGSQGETRSSLVRTALGTHRFLKIKKGDLIVFSARSIPGNEKKISKLIDFLKELGADIITAKDAPDIHVSGHAHRQEIAKMIELIKPKYYTPIHGNYSFLIDNESILSETAWKPQSIIIENGDVLEVSSRSLRTSPSQIEINRLFVDAESNMPIEFKTLDNRLQIGELGLAVVSGLIKKHSKKWLLSPKVELVGLGIRKGRSSSLMQLSCALANELKKVLDPQLSALDYIDEIKVEKITKKSLQRLLSQYYNKRPVVIVKIMIL
jgi:ribonuclease J